MTTIDNEHISSLVDDELHGAGALQALDQLCRDDEWRAVWGRYQLVSDALHGNLSHVDTRRLHERVWQALEHEPTVLAPRRNTRLPPLAKQAVGVAIAASVAAVAILAVQNIDGKAPTAAPTMQVAQSVRPAGDMLQLTGTGEAPVVAGPALRGRLNPYLVNHNEYSVSSGMQGVLPYARIVSYENR